MRGPAIYTEAQKIYDEGRAKEREEFQYNTAKSMLFDGVSDEFILKYFSITPEKLEGIKAEISKVERS